MIKITDEKTNNESVELTLKNGNCDKISDEVSSQVTSRSKLASPLISFILGVGVGIATTIMIGVV